MDTVRAGNFQASPAIDALFNPLQLLNRFRINLNTRLGNAQPNGLQPFPSLFILAAMQGKIARRSGGRTK